MPQKQEISASYLASQQMNDLKRMLDNAHRHQFLAIVTTVHHQRVSQTFNNRTLSLAETFHLVAAS